MRKKRRAVVKEVQRDEQDFADSRIKYLDDRLSKQRAELDGASHEIAHLRQTIQSLHYAMNTMAAQIGRYQLKERKFASAGDILIPVPDGDRLALAK